jgi:two-component system, NarL family, nitrate/nitrite response regulator NarL
MMEIAKERSEADIQILIADEPPIYGDGLRALLEKQPDFRVVGLAPDGAAAVQMSRERKPDVLLLNLKMAAGDGMGVLDKLQTLSIPVRTLLLANSLSGEDLMHALLLGARGVVLKTSCTEALIKGIRGVMVGQYWIGAETGASMVGVLRELHGSGKKCTFGLTPRELQVVETVVAGCSNAEIAKQYGISEQTVKHHLSSIFDKAGVFNRIELALFAINHGLTRISRG